MSELFRRFIRPARKQSIFRTERSGASGVGRVFGGLVACMFVTALLSSQRLVSMAERQEFGADRDRWLAAAEVVDALASPLGLDRPAAAVESALGRNEIEPTEVILGELAARGQTTTTSIETTTTAPSAPDVSITTTTIPPTTTTSTIPTPPILGEASINSPLRVWSGGDSLGEYIGSELLNKVAEPDLSVVELDFAISTGIARPDYFDWPARFSEVMQRQDRPNVVVFMVGGNDDQDLRVDGERIVVGTPEWQAAYRERVATMMDIAAYPDVQMLWVNLPPMRDGRRQTISLEINLALAAEADLRSWVQVIDIVDMFTGPNGGYEQFIDAPDGSATRKARANDGVHITRSASGWVAELVWATVATQWEFDFLTPLTTMPPTTVPSITEVPLTTTPDGNPGPPTVEDGS